MFRLCDSPRDSIKKHTFKRESCKAKPATKRQAIFPHSCEQKNFYLDL